MSELVTSPANPVVKRIRALADRKHRRREGVFVVDGLQPVWRVEQAGWAIDTLIYSSSILANSPGLETVRRCAHRGIRTVDVSPELFGKMSDRDGPGGLMAIVRMPDITPGDLHFDAHSNILVLESIANPGNLGTLIRTADAAGFTGVVLVGASADPFAPTCVKASMGSLFALPIVAFSGVQDFTQWASAAGIVIVAASGDASVPCWDVEFPSPCALVLGSEGPGLSERMRDASQTLVSIPMTGTAESLNVAIAGGILMYEVARQKRLFS